MPARYLPQPMRSLARRCAPRRMIGVSSSLISCSPESAMNPNTGDRMLTVGIAARTLAVAVDVGAEIPGDIAVLGQATVDEGRGLIVLRRNGCGIFVRHAVVEFVHRDGP